MKSFTERGKEFIEVNELDNPGQENSVFWINMFSKFLDRSEQVKCCEKCKSNTAFTGCFNIGNCSCHKASEQVKPLPVKCERFISGSTMDACMECDEPRYAHPNPQPVKCEHKEGKFWTSTGVLIECASCGYKPVALIEELDGKIEPIEFPGGNTALSDAGAGKIINKINELVKAYTDSYQNDQTH